MLYEYALEPSLLSSWSDFRFFISQFGFDQGRLISRFPKKWKRMVYESLGNCKDIERARIEEALRRIDNRMVPRQANSWDVALDWLGNAETEHSVRQFRAIIAETNARKHPTVIVGTTLDDTLETDALPGSDSRRLWKADRAKVIGRNAPEMADAIDVFIKRAETILFVDKHFGPENARHRIPFKEFVSRLDERGSKAMPKTVAVHCARKSTPTFFKSQCETQLAAMVPLNVKVQFHRWAPDDLHNRFVLTELGGVAFLEGLDQHMGGAGRTDDLVVLLNNDVARQLIKNYTPGESSFRHIDVCEIVGSRII